MAQPTNTFSSYDQVGIREDLTDVIHDVSPSDTPFYSSIAKTKATSRYHEWQTDALRTAAANAHLDYIDYLIDTRSWLAGATMSMADLAAAAQISVADYLGGIDWAGHEQTRAWYAMFKSRPSFRPLLSERMGNIPPPAYYEKVDF